MPPRLRLQQAEVFGPDNRWFCSQSHGRPIDEPELLWQYFIRSGGAGDFARRWDEAMSATNRWFCSECYGRPVADEETLWTYYLHRSRPAAASLPRQVKSEAAAVMAMA
jgi:hypothetical protein